MTNAEGIIAIIGELRAKVDEGQETIFKLNDIIRAQETELERVRSQIAVYEMELQKQQVIINDLRPKQELNRETQNASKLE